MGWFQRLFGGRHSSESPAKTVSAITPHVVPAGRQAGGTGDLTATQESLQKAAFHLHDAAREFLREYHGQCLDVPIAGAAEIEGFVHFAPEMVLRLLGQSDRSRLAKLMPATACPVGTTSGHTICVFMDDKGRCYLLDMEWTLFAELAATPTEMVQILCDGRNGRVDSHVLDEHGGPTGQWIREGDEHRWWELADFPLVAPYLPPVSLSPGRRPPTWRAMVRAAEKSLAPGSAPTDLIVSCGGFMNCSGQM